MQGVQGCAANACMAVFFFQILQPELAFWSCAMRWKIPFSFARSSSGLPSSATAPSARTTILSAASTVRIRCQKQCDRDKKNERAFRKGQIDRLRCPADLAGIFFRFGAVILNGILKRLKGIDGLLEDLHNGNSPDIFGSRLAHHILCRLVFHHDLRILSAHHCKHGNQ